MLTPTDVSSHRDKYKALEASNKRFAFWHDVGVIALSALATALLGVAEMEGSPNCRNVIRTATLFITAMVTVFSACNQFFKFKEHGEAYGLARARLSRLLRRLQADSERTSLSAEEATELEDVLTSTELVEWSIWTRATIIAAATAGLVLLGVVGGCLWCVSR